MRYSPRRAIRIAIATTIAVIPIAAFTSTAHAVADYTVTSTADTNTSGTLRWAINQANATAGAETIAFSASFNGTITLTSNLPTIAEDLTITGPGETKLTIDGDSSYRPFTNTTAGTTLSISHMTLTKGTGVGFGPNQGSLIWNNGTTLNATSITVKNDIGVAVFNLGANTLATYTDCTFKDNNIGISSDHGNTPSSVQSTESDYQNRTYIVNSTFLRNTEAIYAERFTKITGSTFTDNNYAADIKGLNRAQILTSTFTNNYVAINHTNWTPVEWTSVGNNNRYINNNTFTNNQYAIVLGDYWNDGHASQQWSTVTNNSWDGVGGWIYGYKWSDALSGNEEFDVRTVNSAGRDWHESGNVLVSPTTTTTTPPTTTTTTPQNTTTTTASNTQVTTTTVVSSGGSVGVSGGSTSGSTTTIAGGNKYSTEVTTVAPESTTTTSTLPAPDAPEVAPGEGGATVDGESVKATVTRVNNALVVSAAGIEANIYGETADGSRIGLDADGKLQLNEQDLIGVRASGFVPSSQIEVWLFSSPTRLGVLRVSLTGSVMGRFPIPQGLEVGDHRIVLKGANNKGQDVVLGIGVSYGKVDNNSTWTRLLIAIPVALAVIFGLIIPTTLKRRREHQNA